MLKVAPPLRPGDTIAIIAPAKAIEKEKVIYAKTFFEEHGYKVQISEHCLGNYNYFSGTLEERKEDLQWAIDHEDIKAIVCARGGYGCVQLVDKINWSSMKTNPKWLLGFSDVTVFHSRLSNLGLCSIHSTSPLNFAENTEAALNTLLSAVQGNQYDIRCGAHKANTPGKTSGRLFGGNLSILYSLLGTNDQVNYDDTILFIEDLGEALYVFDRMFYALSKAGVLDKLKGLVIGGVTDIKDSAIPFGETIEEIILRHVSDKNIPVVFGFPAGHFEDNRALRFGQVVDLEVTKEHALLSFPAIKQ